jgi:hypothetical protein
LNSRRKEYRIGIGDGLTIFEYPSTIVIHLKTGAIRVKKVQISVYTIEV